MFFRSEFRHVCLPSGEFLIDGFDIIDRVGEIIGYNATGYFMNHTQRQLAAPAISAEEAAQRVSSHLQVRKTELAVMRSYFSITLFILYLL